MQCYVDTKNIRAFARGISTAARLSDEIFFDCKSSQLCLKTLNSERTVFYNSYFPRCFFVNYECNEPLICSIKSKSAILPFRNINALEKRGGTCVLNISSQRDDVLVTIECEQSCNSEFRLPKMDNNLFEVEFHTDLPNHIAMDVKSMQNYISGYSSSIDFVTIKVSSEGVHFESFAFGPKNMMSRMELAPTLFDEFHITSEEEIAITFCYKSFRTFLSSIECKNSLCRIYLDKSNQPLFMLVKSGDHESRMIASCLDVSDGSTNSSLESSNPLTVAHSTKSNTQEETVTEEAGLSPKSGECRTQNNQPIAAASAVANSSDSDKTNVNTLPLPNVTQSRSRQERPFTTPRSIRRPLVGQMISPTRNESISNPNESILIQAQTPNRPEPIHVHKEAQATDEVAYDESFSELQLDDITLDQIPSDALISNQSVRPQVEATNNVTTTTTQNNTTSHSSIIDTHATISNDMISIKQTSEEEFDTNCSTPEIDQEMYERLTGSQQTAPPNLTLTNPGNRTTTHHSIITTQSRHPPLSADVQSELASIINSEFDEDFDEDDTPSHMNPTPLTCLSAGTSTQLSNQAPAPPVSFQIYQDTTMQTNDIDTSLANETNATNDLSTSEEPASLIMNSVTMRGPLDWFLTQPIVLCGSDDEDDPSLYDLNQFQQLLDENAQYLP